jgi:hypothetical protein
MRGGSLINEASPLVAEYNVRTRLAKLGFTSDLSKLDCLRALAFAEIDSVRDDQIERDRKKAAKK